MNTPDLAPGALGVVEREALGVLEREALGVLEREALGVLEREALGVECAWPNPYCPIPVTAAGERAGPLLRLVRPRAKAQDFPNRGGERATRG